MSIFLLQAPLFQKGIGKTGNDLRHGTAPTANPRLVTDSVSHAHSEIWVLIVEAQKQNPATHGFRCQTTLALTVMSSCHHTAWDKFVSSVCTLRATLLLL